MHIDDKVLQNYHKGILETKELVEVMEHIETCSFCADRLMSIEEEDIIQSPRYLKETILKRTQMPDVKINIHMRNTSKKAELFQYSFKTTAAVIGALILLFSISYVNTSNVMERKERVSVSSNLGGQLYEKSNKVIHNINCFSNEIINGGRN